MYCVFPLQTITLVCLLCSYVFAFTLMLDGGLDMTTMLLLIRPGIKSSTEDVEPHDELDPNLTLFVNDACCIGINLLYAHAIQRFQKIYLHLFTDCFMKISLQSSKQIQNCICSDVVEEKSS